jgi:hypothetical protein
LKALLDMNNLLLLETVDFLWIATSDKDLMIIGKA